MAFTTRRPKVQPAALAAPVPGPDQPEPDPIDGEVMPLASAAQDIPPHVWNMLQEAGELAAQRLVSILKGKAFMSYAPSAQRALIELALTRAYGLPVRKALNVNLSTSDADAVAASLADLQQALPEHARGAVRDAFRDNVPDK